MKADVPPPAATSVLLYIALAMLFVLGLGLSAAGADGLANAVGAMQARHWPVKEARLDRCDLSIDVGRHRKYWQISAAWSYGEGLREHYAETWPVDGTPPREPVDAIQVAAVTAQYCHAPGIKLLRISPSRPELAQRNAAVANADAWGFVFPSLLLIAGLFCWFWAGRSVVQEIELKTLERKALSLQRVRNRHR
ncbi:hypothetical protein [Trinickia acidisoli]|uniref:hypothetical protein n=1 Tax=Trinickia acidisoli TaxID=2767482 RepID=UPI001A8C2BA5|nr:hypothetical protein [Trinickia acidisoli]